MRRSPHLITLILLTAFSTLSLNMFLPALAQIADDLQTDYGTAAWAMSGYLAVTAVFQLVLGPLSDRIGRRPVLLGAVALFTLASVGCALATDIRSFLLYRMLQGGMIAGYALSLAIVRDTHEERQAASLIGYISMAMSLAPMLGPMLGGALDTLLGWRAIFWSYAASGGLMALLVWWDLPHSRPDRSPKTRPEPQHTLLRAPLFWAYALCSAFSTGAFYIFLTGAPLVAHRVFGTSSATLGLYIGSITAGFMLGSFLSGRLATQVAPIRLIVIGRCAACLGPLAGLIGLWLGMLSPQLVFGSTIFVGLGNGLTIPASNAGALSVHPRLAGSAAGISGALTVALGAGLTRLTGQMITLPNPAAILLGLIALSGAAGLVAALLARHLRSEDLDRAG